MKTRIVTLSWLVLGAAWPAGAQDENVVRLTIPDAIVNAKHDITVSSPLSGIVIDVPVKEGQWVDKDTLLAKLDDEQALYQVELYARRSQSTAAIEKAEKQYDEYLLQCEANLILWKDGEKISLLEKRTTEVRRDIAQLDMTIEAMTRDENKVQLKMANKRQRDHQIKAPTQGFVAKLLKHHGEGVQDLEAVARIIDTSSVLVEGWVSVAERYHFANLDGHKATVTLNLRPDVRYAGKVMFVDPEINSAAGQFRIRVEVDNPQFQIWPGMRATIELEFPQVVAAKD